LIRSTNFWYGSKPRAYPGLILEGSKKKSGGAKSHFFAQKYQFFSEIDFFKRKICPLGRAAAPPSAPSSGTPFVKTVGLHFRLYSLNIIAQLQRKFKNNIHLYTSSLFGEFLRNSSIEEEAFNSPLTEKVCNSEITNFTGEVPVKNQTSHPLISIIICNSNIHVRSTSFHFFRVLSNE